ncbi:MAG TPA: class I SAM-dependent methyltransferase, partial [Flavitalea sp.]|nr:class I SAM-dependent methyltransferase [Flavitalea sp.]
LKIIHLFYQVRRYIAQYFKALNGRGHGIHSPFVFDFVKTVLNSQGVPPATIPIETLRSKLLKDKRKLQVTDYGAGSMVNNSANRTIASICQNTSKSKKLALLLHRIVHKYQPESILELGTSLGISTAYLATGNTSAKVITCEGSDTVAAIARENFRALALNNIETREGNFDDIIPVLVSTINSIDLVFIDGNHREVPTIKYFESILKISGPQTIMIFDDIHWSPGMERAWNRIKSDPRVRMSIDLFFVGIVLFREEFKVKQNFVIHY